MAVIVEEGTEEITFLNGAYADKMASSCNLVKAYKKGGTIVRFFDGAYANKTPQEIEKKIEQLNRTCWKCVVASREAGQEL